MVDSLPTLPAANIPDLWGVVANHKDGDKKMRPGAQCWLYSPNPGDGYERNGMRCRSRGGRLINIWIKAAKLVDWRVKWIPPEVRKPYVYPMFDTREKADAYLAAMQIRRFDGQDQVETQPGPSDSPDPG